MKLLEVLNAFYYFKPHLLTLLYCYFTSWLSVLTKTRHGFESDGVELEEQINQMKLLAD